MNQAHAIRGVGAELHQPRCIKLGGDGNIQIGSGQHGCGFFRPLGQFEAGAGEDIPKACLLPFPRIGKAVKVKVPDGQAGQLVGFHDRIGGAFDAPRDAQGMQQMAHQCGLARTQIAMQGDEHLPQFRVAREVRCKPLRSQFVAPAQVFYNREVTINSTQFDANQLVSQMQAWARELGFSQIGVTGVDLSSAEPGLRAWLAQGFHGDMDYMQRHGLRRARPAELVPGTLSVVTARMDYLPQATAEGWVGAELQRLHRPGEAVVSMYARGRDYHKVLRTRLQALCDRIAQTIAPLGYRVFTDSAPVLEVELATRSAQGWRGKHTLLLNREGGSLFFLGEIFLNIELPPSALSEGHCGTCTACIDICPTRAIVAPYRLDARRCISYLTIEHAGAIPLELRPLLGNRIYGCDDCQLVCPWNKFAKRSALADFDARDGLTGQQLTALFAWTEAQFLQHTEGSPIRRIGFERWQRNIAVALGNALRSGESVKQALALQAQNPSPLVREHVVWALEQAAVEPSGRPASCFVGWIPPVP